MLNQNESYPVARIFQGLEPAMNQKIMDTDFSLLKTQLVKEATANPLVFPSAADYGMVDNEESRNDLEFRTWHYVDPDEDFGCLIQGYFSKLTGERVGRSIEIFETGIAFLRFKQGQESS